MAKRAQQRTMKPAFPAACRDQARADRVHSSASRIAWFVQHVRECTRTSDVSDRHGPVHEFPENASDLGATEVPIGDGREWAFADMLAATSTDAVAVLFRGEMVYERYFNGMSVDTPHAYYSISKSIASCVAAQLVDRRQLELERRLEEYVPELEGSAYGDATVEYLLDMSVGIDYVEDYEDDDSDDGRLQRLYGYKPKRSADEPGSTYDFATSKQKEGEHGAVFHYVSLNTDVLGWVMERATGRTIPELIASELWRKLGTEHDAYIALDGAGSAQLEAGFASSLRDLARFGQVLCQGGLHEGRPVVPRWWIDDIRSNGNRAAFAASADADLLPSGSYRKGFWVSDLGDHVPIVGLGKYGQMLYVNPEVGVVVARFCSQPRPAIDSLATASFHSCDSLARVLASQ
jgi:CubicO group peptidase (beta-lactamase class C family)